jgi:hypothetical protein
MPLQTHMRAKYQLIFPCLRKCLQQLPSLPRNRVRKSDYCSIEDRRISKQYGEISRSHGGEYKHDCLLERYDVYSGSLPTFHPNDGSSKHLRNVRKLLSGSKTHHRRHRSSNSSQPFRHRLFTCLRVSNIMPRERLPSSLV